MASAARDRARAGKLWRPMAKSAMARVTLTVAAVFSGVSGDDFRGAFMVTSLSFRT
jgi:hypothetical protein